MDANTELLTEVSRNARMGKNAVETLIDKVGDETMRKELTSRKGEYEKLEQSANNQLSQAGIQAEPLKATDKAGLWMGLQMNTIADKSNSHIAEMMIQGSTMGVIEVTKLKNRYPNAAPEARSLADDFLSTERGGIERMRAFL